MAPSRGVLGGPPGEASGRARLKTSQVVEIRRAIRAGAVLDQLAEVYPVTKSALWKAAVGATWSIVNEQEPPVERFPTPRWTAEELADPASATTRSPIARRVQRSRRGKRAGPVEP